MEWYVGTSGFSYKEWKGNFYPEKIPAKEMLSYYATRLKAVEINNTFYRLPKRELLEGWAEQVPEPFRFSIKASRRITHFKRLKEPYDETDYLVETVGALGERLGVVLFQLPPHSKRDDDRLAAFVANLPDGFPATFEFRHESWNDPAVHDILRAKNCALCIAEADDDEPVDCVGTADWGYLRLRKTSYAEKELESWRDRARDLGWKHAFVFFKHEDEGTGPKLAELFLEITA